MNVSVNGQLRAAPEAGPSTLLLDALRDGGTTSAKEGCREGDCGACAVLVLDRVCEPPRWRLTNACLTPLGAVAGGEVCTADGLGTGSSPHPAVAALANAGGTQCGYCSPGFAIALAEAAHRPELRARSWRREDQLSGNLCRCTGYRPIRAALETVAGSCPDDPLARAVAGPSPTFDAALPASVVRPTTVEGLVAARVARPDAWVVGGATDLGLRITMQGARPEALVLTTHIPALRAFEIFPDRVRVGAGLVLADLEDACGHVLPSVHRMLRYFGSRPIKSRATVAGNLVNASPIGDLAPVLLALGAEVLVMGPQGGRAIPIDAWFAGYRRTTLGPDEVVVAVDIRRAAPTDRVTALKVSRRREMDISAVAMGGRVGLDGSGRVVEARLAYGGVAATPVRVPTVETALVGRPWTLATVAEVEPLLDAGLSPISDLRGTAAWRRTLVRHLLRGFVLETADRPVAELVEGHIGTVALEGR